MAGLSGGAGASLEGVGLTLSYYAGSTPLGAAPSAAGTYTVAASFAGSADYLARSVQATFTIAQATPTVSVTDAGGTYTGSPFPATATVAGSAAWRAGASRASAPTLTYYAGSTLLGAAPSAAGTYSVQASFAGSADYLARSVQATFTIAQATPTVRVTDAGGDVQRVAFPATATVTGVSGPGGLEPGRCDPIAELLQWDVHQLIAAIGIDRANRDAGPRRQLHRAGGLRRQHGLRRLLRTGGLWHRPGDAGAEHQRCGRDVQRVLPSPPRRR